MTFDEQVGGIEDGIIALLAHRCRDGNPKSYLNEIHSYGGELDEKKVKEVLEQFSPRFPVMLVAYGEGDDTEAPAKGSALGEPRIFRHDCNFLVVACTNNARGETEQRRGAVGDIGVYEMIADIRESLSGVKFARREDPASIVLMVPNQPLPDGDVLLNLDPLKPVSVEMLARLEGVTAYAQRFQTYFKWTEPDRRVPGTPVEELVFDLETLNQVTAPAGGKPGVELE